MEQKKVLITRDSTSDLPADILTRFNIKTIPLVINLDSKSYKDGIDIDPDFIYDYHSKHGVLPKTSAANVADMIDFFQSFVDEGYSIVHFTISSKLSSTFQNSLIDSQEFEDVYVVDTANLSTGEGLVIMKAAEMALDGKSAKEIYDTACELTQYVDASFVIDSLEYLHKGGRCSALASLGANLLKLKPCIEVRNGGMGVGKKYRGKYIDALTTYVNEKLEDTSNINLDRIFITHAGCDDEIVNTVKELVEKNASFKEIIISRAGCTISSHCGRNTLGILYFRTEKV